MTRAVLTGCLLGCCVLAGYALGRYTERYQTRERQRQVLLALYPAPAGLSWEQTHEGLWRLRSGGAL